MCLDDWFLSQLPDYALQTVKLHLSLSLIKNENFELWYYLATLILFYSEASNCKIYFSLMLL